MDDKQLITAIKDLTKAQEQQNKRQQQEYELEKERIRSNEKIALATLEAQQGDRAEQFGLIANLEKRKHTTIWIIGLLTVILLGIAMMTGNTEIATDIVKMGGAVLLGYVAGVGRGKAQALENQKNNE